MIPSGPLAIDLSVTHALQSFQPQWLTWVAKFFSAIGQPEIVVPLFAIIGLWLFYKHQSIRELKLIFIVLGNFLTLIIKGFVHRPRPTSDFVNVLIHESSTSFPSGHALAAVITTGAIWVLFKTKRPMWIHAALLIYILLVGWSRVYLGVHWLSDVLAGYFIGALWLIIVHILSPKKRPS